MTKTTRLDNAIEYLLNIVDVLMAYRGIAQTGRDCNTCKRKRQCEHCPKLGQTVRYNCFLWEGDSDE